MTFWLNEARGGTEPHVEWKVVRACARQFAGICGCAFVLVRVHAHVCRAPSQSEHADRSVLLCGQVQDIQQGMPTRKALVWRVLRPIAAGEELLTTYENTVTKRRPGMFDSP